MPNTRSYKNFVTFNVTRSIYENDVRSNSELFGPYYYIATNNANKAGNFALGSDLKPTDRNFYWNSAVQSGGVWNDAVHVASGNASSQFPDDVYEVTVKAYDQSGNEGQKTVRVLLTNWLRSVSTDKRSYQANEAIQITGGVQFRANQTMPLFAVPFAPGGKALPANDTPLGTKTINVTSDANGKLKPASIAAGVLTPGKYWLVVDYNGDGVYTEGLDAAKLIQVGAAPLAMLGDLVWSDLNADGVRQPDEPGVPGVAVRLLDGSNQVARDWVVTGSDGSFLFTDLVPGSYRVDVDLPADYLFTKKGFGADPEADSDINPSLGWGDLLTLNPGDFRADIDVGVYQPVTIAGVAWDDLNGDGVRQDGEPLFAGVNVKLLDSANQIVGGPVTTGADGSYQFSGLTPGNYRAFGGFPPGYLFTKRLVGAEPQTNNDIDPATGLSEWLTLVSGEFRADIDAGVYRPGVIGDLVWEDANGDGIRQSNESGVAGAVVRLLDSAYQVVRGPVTTGANGFYEFAGLLPGDFRLWVDYPPGYLFSKRPAGADPTQNNDIDPSTGLSDWLTLASGDYRSDIDAGVYRTVAIGDLVWDDLNGDGIHQSNEPGIAGARVRLLDSAGAVIRDWTTTGASGSYQFTNLAPGNYRVWAEYPPGYLFTKSAAGSDRTTDSDLNPQTGTTALLMVRSGEYRSDIDVGVYRPTRFGSIGDFAWDDVNNNGVYDAGEVGRAGVTVKLFDSTGYVIQTKVTDASGFYTFSNLGAGSYFVEVIAPQGARITTPNYGQIDLDPNQSRDDIDVGVYSPGVGSGGLISGVMWDDGTEDFADGVRQGSEGTYAPSGVVVELLRNGVVIATQTVENGNTGYTFSGLASGRYLVRFTPPPRRGYSSGPTYLRYKLTLQDRGDDRFDSDASQASGTTNDIDLGVNEQRYFVDAGFIAVYERADGSEV